MRQSMADSQSKDELGDKTALVDRLVALLWDSAEENHGQRTKNQSCGFGEAAALDKLSVCPEEEEEEEKTLLMGSINE